MHSTLIAEISTPCVLFNVIAILHETLAKGDEKSETLQKLIASNPAKFDLTYALWQLVMGARGNIEVYTENLHNFTTEFEDAPNFPPNSGSGSGSGSGSDTGVGNDVKLDN